MPGIKPNVKRNVLEIGEVPVDFDLYLLAIEQTTVIITVQRRTHRRAHLPEGVALWHCDILKLIIWQMVYSCRDIYFRGSRIYFMMRIHSLSLCRRLLNNLWRAARYVIPAA